ncbi:MAG: hypothetical protein R3E64_03235 [Halioglobus sp.]
MLDLVANAATALQAETASYPDAVQIWMKVMGVSFLFSIFFLFSRAGARWIFAGLVLNILGLLLGKMVFPDVSRTVIGTIVHLVFWPPVLWLVWRSTRQPSFVRHGNRYFNWIYIVWLAWASLLMSISLLFDLRTLISFWSG